MLKDRYRKERKKNSSYLFRLVGQQANDWQEKSSHDVILATIIPTIIFIQARLLSGISISDTKMSRAFLFFLSFYTKENCCCQLNISCGQIIDSSHAQSTSIIITPFFLLFSGYNEHNVIMMNHTCIYICIYIYTRTRKKDQQNN